jgi:hypothetical protein
MPVQPSPLSGSRPDGIVGSAILAERMASKTEPLPSNAPAPGLTAGLIERVASALVLLAVAGALAAGWFYRRQFSDVLNPEQNFGYYLGIVGGTMMLILLGYPLRKRVRPRSRSFGSIRFWFHLHMLLGLLGPTAVLFHARFSSSSFNGTVAMWAMIVVACSGLIGRFFYSRVHRGYSDRKLEMRALRTEMSDLLAQLESAGALPGNVREELEQFEAVAIKAGSAFWSSANAVVGLSIRSRSAERRMLGNLRKIAPDNARALRSTLAAYFIAVRRAAEFALYDRLLRLWHLLHMPLFVILVAAIVLHIVAVHMY